MDGAPLVFVLLRQTKINLRGLNSPELAQKDGTVLVGHDVI